VSVRSKTAGQPAFCGIVIAALLAVASLGACSSKVTETAPPTIPAASPAVSPPTAQVPAGVVLKLPGRPELPGLPAAAAYDTKSAALVVLIPGASSSAGAQAAASLAVLGAGRVPPRVIALPGPASAITTSEDGAAYLSARGGYFVVDIAAGTARRIEVKDQSDTDFTAIARRADGKLVLGSADGAVLILSSESEVGHRVKIFARVDSIVTQGNTAVVLDRGQTSVTAVDAEGTAREALRAGEGATTMVADPAGRVLVADTRGDELLVFSVDPLIMRQRYPVAAAPYGLAGTSRLVWVSQTANNVVVGYDLATGIPVEKVRYPTVQQPNMLSFDAATGTLYVVSGIGAGVQVIERAAETR